MQRGPIGPLCMSAISPKLAWFCSAPAAGNCSAVDTQIVYSHAGKRADGFDETAWLILGFRDDKLVSMRASKTTTN